MPQTKQEKQASVASLADKLSRMKVLVFINFAKLTVLETTEFRNLLRENQIDYLVAKRTLLKLALKSAGLDINLDQAAGSLGLAFGYADEVMPAKLIQQFSKLHPAIKFMGAVYQGAFMDISGVKQLAALLGKDELWAKLVWLFNYPVSGFVNVLAGNLKGLLYALQAIRDKKTI